jgi:hypothetical protein
MSIRKVEPFAGAMWVIDGIKLWWRDVRGFLLYGALLGALSMLPHLLAGMGMPVAGVVQFLALLASALVVMALFYAAREADEGRGAGPMQLARILQDGKTGRLLIGVLGPQLLAMLLVGGLLGWIVGVEEFEKFLKTIQTLQTRGPGEIAPDAMAGLPLGAIALWFIVAIAAVIAIGLLTFTLLPDMIFGDLSFVDALKRSVRACLSNLPAMLFFTIAIAAVGAVAIAVAFVLTGVLIALLGQSIGILALDAIFVALLVPISSNAIYVGWKRLLGPSNDAPASTPKDRVAM